MSLIKWPFKRKQYDGIDNPRYVSDIVAANEAAIDAVKALAGLNDTDFAIVSGLDYNSGALTYSAGIFYLNGSFYYITDPFVAGNFLGPNPQNIMSKGFQDGNSRFIYLQYQGLVSATGGAGYGPEMSGDMNQYRVGSKFLLASVTDLLAIASGLGDAATKNVGTAAGTVAAGDDPRLVYTLSQFKDLFAAKADKTGVLNKLIDGTLVIGTVPNNGLLYTITFGTTLASNNYKAILTIVGTGGAGSDNSAYSPIIRAKTTTHLDVYINGPGTGDAVSNINLDYTIYN